jgi:5-methylcytosine-specific restriction endonuclease McrA
MIFIKRPPPIRFRKKAWLRRKFRAIERANSAEKRSALIDELAGVPSWVTDALVNYFGGKCWYCERKLPRSELVTEHFRPKRRITKVTGHPGYFWLSANTKNFRISCKNCNCRWTNPSGDVAGKGNYFPLMDESKRVSRRTSDLRKEEPLLYDPTCKEDNNQLGFDSNGVCTPVGDDYIDVNRGFSTIALYNLNNPCLVDSRKGLWWDIYKRAELALAIKFLDPNLFEETVKSIRSKAHEHAEYASLARSAIQKANKDFGLRL